MIRHYLKMIWNRRGKNAFLIVELSLAFLIFFGVTAFALKQFQKVLIPEGFDTEYVYNIAPTLDEELDSLEMITIIEQFKQEITALEEVRSATLASQVTPYGGSVWSTTDKSEDGFEYYTDYILCDEDFLEVWGTPLKEGRFFTKADLTGKYVPLTVNQRFVDEFLKDTTALGFTLRFNGSEAVITGIIDHFKYRGQFSDEEPLMLCPVSSLWDYDLLSVAVQPDADETVLKKMSDITAGVTKNFEYKIDKVADMRKVKNRSAWIPLIGLFCLSGFLFINVAMGLFGILRYNISRRRPEIGLRKAMGAHSGHIRRQFIGEMMVLASLALAAGLVFAVQASLLDVLQMESRLYWLAILLASCLIYGIIILCSLIPSSQAAAIDPAVSLHEE